MPNSNERKVRPMDIEDAFFESKTQCMLLKKFFDHVTSDPDGLELNPDQVYGFLLIIQGIIDRIEKGERAFADLPIKSQGGNHGQS